MDLFGCSRSTDIELLKKSVNKIIKADEFNMSQFNAIKDAVLRIDQDLTKLEHKFEKLSVKQSKDK
jgi:ribosome-associated translation inhibitor RaiA